MAEVHTELDLGTDGKVKYAKPYHLWAMGVGAVISGDFFGWQACLAGGFAGRMYKTTKVENLRLGDGGNLKGGLDTAKQLLLPALQNFFKIKYKIFAF